MYLPSSPSSTLAKVKIPVRIHAAHAQSAWVPFLNHVKHELELEDIEGIYDDVDGAPVIRAASLIDGGLYFARPTEVWPRFVGFTYIFRILIYNRGLSALLLQG